MLIYRLNLKAVKDSHTSERHYKMHQAQCESDLIAHINTFNKLAPLFNEPESVSSVNYVARTLGIDLEALFHETRSANYTIEDFKLIKHERMNVYNPQHAPSILEARARLNILERLQYKEEFEGMTWEHVRDKDD